MAPRTVRRVVRWLCDGGGTTHEAVSVTVRLDPSNIDRVLAQAFDHTTGEMRVAYCGRCKDSTTQRCEVRDG